MRTPIAGKTLAIVGLGKSGLAASTVARMRGARVIGFDSNPEALQRAKEQLLHYDGVAREDPDELAQAVVASAPDIIVISPGFPSHAPVYMRASGAGIPVWSEVELAWHVQQPRSDGTFAPWLTVTGSNGKTTTVSMLSSILTTAGLNAPAVGNIGDPIVTHAAAGEVDVLVVELSSFQLHSTHSVVPLASACLNLAADHLDWHGGWDAYLQDKAKVFDRTEKACIYNVADPFTRAMVEAADVREGARAIGITLEVPQRSEFGVVDDILIDRAFLTSRAREALPIATLADLSHLNPAALHTDRVPDHLISNALFAAALARATGISAEAIGAGLRAVPAGDHRIQLIAEKGGVSYVNDSKATNAHAARASLTALPKGRVVWIAGGLAKGATFDELVGEVKDHLRAAVVIGEDRTEMMGALERHAADLPLFEVNEAEHGDVMTSAVRAAARFARDGDTVLLAPACASMDQFTSYEHRGEEFARAVNELVDGPNPG